MTSLSGDFLSSHLIKRGNARITPITSVDKFADVLEGFNHCFGSSNQGGQVDLLLQHVPCHPGRIIENDVCTLIPADIEQSVERFTAIVSQPPGHGFSHLNNE